MDDFKTALEDLIDEAIAAGTSQEEINAALSSKLNGTTAPALAQAENAPYEAGVNAPSSGAAPEQGESEPAPSAAE